MSTRMEGTWDGAGIDCDTKGGRTLNVSVDRDGDIEVMAEVQDSAAWGSGGHATTEVSFYVSSEDWQAIVEHVDREQLRQRGQREAQAS